jgi:hypothetical protein
MKRKEGDILAVIEDIRVYRCKVVNVTGVWPEAFYNPELSAVVRRICMKLREKEFSMGDFHHLYINLTTCLEEGEVKPAAKEPDRYHPWYRYYDVGISQNLYDKLLEPESVPTVTDLIEKVLITQFNSQDFDDDRISECVNEAVSQGEYMLMKFKEKASSGLRTVLYLRYLDSGKYYPLLRVYDAEDQVILEKDLPESQTLDGYGQITLSSKKVVIKPRKIGQNYLQPIEFALK